MKMQLNLDKDIMARVKRELDPSGSWFRNLPALVQLMKLAPYAQEQDARDRKRYGLDKAA